MSFIKLGPHVINSTDPALTWAAAAPVVKALDSTIPLSVARSDAITVFRHCFGPIRTSEDISVNGADVAQQVLNALGGFRPTYVELYNEAELLYDQPSDMNLAEYISMVQVATGVLHQAGLKVAGFSFIPDFPAAEGWQLLAQNAFAGVDALAIHEYWGSEGPLASSTLYHRQIHSWLPYGHPDILITECGRGGGWLNAGLSQQQYVAELQAYDQALAQDNYVLGANVFTAGPTGAWTAYDTDQLVPLLGLQSPPSQQPTNPVVPSTQQGGTLPIGTILAGGVALAVFGYGVYKLATAGEE